MAQSKTFVFEICDSYQKQTYRNRCYIYGANGKLSLNIPVHYSQKNRKNTKEVKIENSSKWQSIHWKSIESAYRTSPFFEFYEDELNNAFTKTNKWLMDYNFECMAVINQCLDFEFSYSTSQYFEKEGTKNDYRSLVNIKKSSVIETAPYIQVFENKHGYLPNLSILDLLFNLGP